MSTKITYFLQLWMFESKKKAYSDNLYDLSSEKFKEHETIIWKIYIYLKIYDFENKYEFTIVLETLFYIFMFINESSDVLYLSSNLNK